MKDAELMQALVQVVDIAIRRAECQVTAKGVVTFTPDALLTHSLFYRLLTELDNRGLYESATKHIRRLYL